MYSSIGSLQNFTVQALAARDVVINALAADYNLTKNVTVSLNTITAAQIL